jgi:hypothetical protein
MMRPPRTVVTFKSRTFNTSEPKSYFINPDCYGDDLCRWLQQQLRGRGVATADEPGQEDFGWYVTFQSGSQQYCFVVGYRPTDNPGDGDWIGEIERQVGLLGSLLGGRKRGIQPEAVEAIHAVLATADLVEQVRWHFACDFSAGREDQGRDHPAGI